MTAFDHVCFLAVIQNEELASEKVVQDLCQSLDKYQSEPWLLDHQLEPLVLSLLAQLRLCLDGHPQKASQLAVLLQHILKVRGYKTVISFFPHSVDDLTLLLRLLASEQSDWQLNYILLLWLALVVKLPFDLQKWHHIIGVSDSVTILEYLWSYARQYLAKFTREREAAAFLCGQLLSRQEAFAKLMPELIILCQSTLVDTASPTPAIGPLTAVSAVLKNITQLDSSTYNDDLYRLLHLTENFDSNVTIRQCRCKIGGRLALLLLAAGQLEHMQIILQDLLSALSDKSSDIRYSAAKHIARIADVLGVDNARQILDAIFDQLQQGTKAVEGKIVIGPTVSDQTWQGCLLCIAELATRRLVAQTHLLQVVRWTTVALQLEVRKGLQVLGSNVRDAAAYVSWTLSDAFTAEDMKPFAKDLAEGLILAALFDREVSVRRAASAAYQEIAGKLVRFKRLPSLYRRVQDVFAHGIDILQNVNFFTVTLKRNAFLQACPAVARHDIYFELIVGHLIRSRLNDWDAATRTLSAASLVLLSKEKPDAVSKIIDRLIESTSTDQNEDSLHGIILALTQFCSICDVANRTKIYNLLITINLPRKRNKQLSDQLLIAVCDLVTASATADAVAANNVSILRLIDHSWQHSSLACYQAGGRAVAVLSSYINLSKSLAKFRQRLEGPANPSQAAAARLVGTFNFKESWYHSSRESTLLALANNVTAFPANTLAFGQATAESRMEAAKSLTAVVDVEHAAQVERATQALLLVCQDYTTDRNGEVGSVVRTAALASLESMTQSRHMTRTLLVQIIAVLLKQMVERQDGPRTQAGQTLCQLLPLMQLESVPGVQELQQLSDLQTRTEMRDRVEVVTACLRCFSIQDYQAQLCDGLALTVGTPPEVELLPETRASLEFFKQSDIDIRDLFLSRLIWAFEQQSSRASSILYALAHIFASLGDVPAGFWSRVVEIANLHQAGCRLPNVLRAMACLLATLGRRPETSKYLQCPLMKYNSAATMSSFDFNSRRSCVYSTKGITASSQSLASAVGISILNKGGNAADAAVAMAAALNVTEPCSTGIGGDMFCLFYNAKDRTVKGLNGSGRAPAALDLNKIRSKGIKGSSIPNLDLNAVTVPGAAAGWCDTLAMFGSQKLSMHELLSPAIELAEEGFSVSDMTAYSWEHAEYTIQRASPNGNEVLLNGRAPKCGEIMTNPCLAQTFRTLAKEGKTGFYQGRIAQAIVDLISTKGGEMTMEDLASHQSTPVDPISYTFAGKATVHECPPNGQGLAALIALGIIDALVAEGKIPNILEMDHNSAEYLHVLIEALRLGFADNFQYVCDMDHEKVPLAELLSKEYFAKRASLIDLKKTTPFTHGRPIASSDTVYFTASDSEGNACSFINSNYAGFGTHAVPKGCGFTLQNRGSNFRLQEGHPNCIAGRKRPYHTIIPAMVTNSDGSLYASYGVMGGFNQPIGHVQVIINLLRGMSPQLAIDSARFTLGVEQDDDEETAAVVMLEEHIEAGVFDQLQAKGHRIERLSGISRMACGRGQIIQRIPQPNNKLLFAAGSDPRADGCAMPQI